MMTGGRFWPMERPLETCPPGTLMSDMNEDQYVSVIEEKARWHDAEELANQIRSGKKDRFSVWEELKKTPDIYRDDMGRRIAKCLHG